MLLGGDVGVPGRGLKSHPEAGCGAQDCCEEVSGGFVVAGECGGSASPREEPLDQTALAIEGGSIRTQMPALAQRLKQLYTDVSDLAAEPNPVSTPAIGRGEGRYIKCTACGANRPIAVKASPVTARRPATQASAIMPVMMVADASTMPI